MSQRFAARAATEVKETDCKQLNLCGYKTKEGSLTQVKVINKIKPTVSMEFFDGEAIHNSTSELTSPSANVKTTTGKLTSLKDRLKRHAARYGT